jgi:predicted RNA binding protein YcfA (HicA-like mRNA interferase family)
LAVLAEQDMACREQLDLVTCLLKDGYKVVPQGDALDVYVQPSNGGITVFSVSENDLRTKGIEGVVRQSGIRWARPAVPPKPGSTVA